MAIAGTTTDYYPTTAFDGVNKIQGRMEEVQKEGEEIAGGERGGREGE